MDLKPDTTCTRTKKTVCGLKICPDVYKWDILSGWIGSKQGHMLVSLCRKASGWIFPMVDCSVIQDW